MPYQTLILGGVSWNTMLYVDTFPDPTPQTVFTHRIHETVGSTGSGKALNLSKLDFTVTLYGMIGYDPYGAKIEDYFEEQDVPFVYDISTVGTERHVNFMDEAGERISVISRSGGSPEMVDLARMDALIAKSDYIVLNIVNYCRPLLPLIKRHGKEVWTDLHDYDGSNPYYDDFINAADYIFLSSDAMPEYRPFMQRMIYNGKKLVVCTHGTDGATALTPDGKWIETPIIPAYAKVDTNGAGDAFFSGFLYGHAKGYPIEVCLRLATVVAGLCITSYELALPEMTVGLVEAEYARRYGAEL